MCVPFLFRVVSNATCVYTTALALGNRHPISFVFEWTTWNACGVNTYKDWIEEGSHWIEEGFSKDKELAKKFKCFIGFYNGIKRRRAADVSTNHCLFGFLVVFFFLFSFCFLFLVPSISSLPQTCFELVLRRLCRSQFLTSVARSTWKFSYKIIHIGKRPFREMKATSRKVRVLYFFKWP